QPATEAIVEAAARLARKHETGLDEQIVADAFHLHPAEQGVPRRGRIAEPDAPRDLGIDAARVEVLARLGAARLPERSAVKLGSQRHHPPQGLELTRGLGLGVARR